MATHIVGMHRSDQKDRDGVRRHWKRSSSSTKWTPISLSTKSSHMCHFSLVQTGRKLILTGECNSTSATVRHSYIIQCYREIDIELKAIDLLAKCSPKINIHPIVDNRITSIKEHLFDSNKSLPKGELVGLTSS
jgi:hypothetical protein